MWSWHKGQPHSTLHSSRCVWNWLFKLFAEQMKSKILRLKLSSFSQSFQMLLQVSWVRHRDIHLLTVGRYTYTSDQRFRAIHQPQTEDWMLQIKYPQHRDSGIYECQVSTTPHMSHYIHLNVVGKLEKSKDNDTSWKRFKCWHALWIHCLNFLLNSFRNTIPIAIYLKLLK